MENIDTGNNNSSSICMYVCMCKALPIGFIGEAINELITAEVDDIKKGSKILLI